jgi:uncharacterized protein involved in outer membrane biogenesis
MKMLFRWAFRLLILLVVLLVAAVLLLNTIAREILEYQISNRTGLEAKIGSVDIGLLNPRATVAGLVIYNSPDFGGAPLLDLPEFHVEYDRGALWSGKLHLRLLRLNLAQLNVVEDKNGRLNLQALEKQMNSTGGPVVSSKPSSGGYQFAGIDTLNLTMRGATFQSFKNPAANETLNPDLRNQIFSKVNSPAAFDALVDFILLRSGCDLLGHDSSHANDPWQYWRGKLAEVGW